MRPLRSSCGAQRQARCRLPATQWRAHSACVRAAELRSKRCRGHSRACWSFPSGGGRCIRQLQSAVRGPLTEAHRPTGGGAGVRPAGRPRFERGEPGRPLPKDDPRSALKRTLLAKNGASVSTRDAPLSVVAVFVVAVGWARRCQAQQAHNQQHKLSRGRTRLQRSPSLTGSGCDRRSLPATALRLAFREGERSNDVRECRCCRVWAEQDRELRRRARSLAVAARRAAGKLELLPRS